MKYIHCRACGTPFIQKYKRVYCDTCREHGVPMNCVSCGEVFRISTDQHNDKERHIRTTGGNPFSFCPACATRFRNIGDEFGKTYGCVKVIRFHGTKNGAAYWLCQCECGDVRAYRANELRRLGDSRTCKHKSPRVYSRQAICFG